MLSAASVLKIVFKKSNHSSKAAHNLWLRSIKLEPSSQTVKSGFRLVKRKNRSDSAFSDLEAEYTDAHHEIQFPDFSLTVKKPNNCCCLSDKSAILIEHICFWDEIPVVVDRKFIGTAPIANYPCDSRDMGIFQAQTLSESQTWNIQKAT